MSSAFWIFLSAFFFVIEAIGPNLTTIWFALGAFITFIASLFFAELETQLFIFFIVSISALFGTRPFVKNFKVKPTPVNADRMIGKKADVVIDIKAGETGRIRLDGIEWSAKSEDEINAGEKCEILEIDSTLLTVKKA